MMERIPEAFLAEDRTGGARQPRSTGKDRGVTKRRIVESWMVREENNIIYIDLADVLASL
jgi:hypothetical protein